MDNYVSQEYAVELWRYGIHLECEKRFIVGESHLMSFDELKEGGWDDHITEVDIRRIWGKSLEAPNLSELLDVMPQMVKIGERNAFMLLVRSSYNSWVCHYVYSYDPETFKVDFVEQLVEFEPDNSVCYHDNAATAVASTLVLLFQAGIYKPNKSCKGFNPN